MNIRRRRREGAVRIDRAAIGTSTGVEGWAALAATSAERWVVRMVEQTRPALIHPGMLPGLLHRVGRAATQTRHRALGPRRPPGPS